MPVTRQLVNMTCSCIAMYHCMASIVWGIPMTRDEACMFRELVFTVSMNTLEGA